MKKILQVEFSKLIHSKRYIITILISVALAIISSIYSIHDEYCMRADLEKYWLMPDGIYKEDPFFCISTLYNTWIGGESGAWSTHLFFYLLPAFSAVSCGLIIYDDMKSGYVKYLLPKYGRYGYLFSKYIVGFVSAGVAILIPLLINLLIVACFIPARSPDSVWSEYYSITKTYMWSYLYYTKPLIYVFLYLLIDFVYAGLFSCLTLGLSLFIRKLPVLLCGPFFSFLGLQYVVSLLTDYRFYLELSPFNFLRAGFCPNITNGYIIFGEGCLLLLGSIILAFIKVKNDVFETAVI